MSYINYLVVYNNHVCGIVALDIDGKYVCSLDMNVSKYNENGISIYSLIDFLEENYGSDFIEKEMTFSEFQQFQQ